MSAGELNVVITPVRAKPVHVIALFLPESVILHADAGRVLPAVCTFKVDFADAGSLIIAVVQMVSQGSERVLKLRPVCPLVVAVRVEPGKNGHAVRHADGIIYKALAELHTLGSNGVNIGRADKSVPVAAQIILSELITHDNKQVFLFHLRAPQLGRFRFITKRKFYITFNKLFTIINFARLKVYARIVRKEGKVFG